MERVENIEGRQGLERKDMEKRDGIRLELVKRLIIEEIELKEDSRSRWMRKWDISRKFFHNFASHHREVNYREELEVKGRTACIQKTS